MDAWESGELETILMWVVGAATGLAVLYHMFAQWRTCADSDS